MSHIFHSLFLFIKANQFAAAGLLLGSLATLLALIRKVPFQIFHKVKVKLITTMEINTKSETYNWLIAWLATYPSKNKFRTVKPHITWKQSDNTLHHAKWLPQVAFSPSAGMYVIHYKGSRILINMSKQDQMMDKMVIGERETIFLTAMGNKKKLFQELLHESYKVYQPESSEEIIVYHYGMEWKEVDRKRPRYKNTLVYEGDTIEQIIGDAERFLERREWYNNMGIPWRRGYLLYGEPGNGKSSLALCLASHLKTNICVLSLTALLSDRDLLGAITSMPKGAVLLLEDIDASYEGRTRGSDHKDSTGISFSGLLNALDGMMATEGRILVMTTNHKEKLDPALIRQGRADVHLYIGNANKWQLKTMFLRFFNSPELAEQFSVRLPENEISMSVLQEYMLSRSNAADALFECKSLIKEAGDDDGNGDLTKNLARFVGLDCSTVSSPRES